MKSLKTLGEDYKYLSDAEEVSAQKLFADLSKDLDDEDGESTNPELAYLAVIRGIRDTNPELFNKIKRLPLKAKTAKKDEEVIANHMPRAKTWGDGSKNFLRTIYSYSQTHKKHFYEEYLEPLFYDTLNRNRGAMGYCPALHCRVPFLSGGLFDPIDNPEGKVFL